MHPLKEAAPLISHSVRLANCGRVVVLTTSSMDEVESQSNNSMEGDRHMRFIKRELHQVSDSELFSPPWRLSASNIKNNNNNNI